MKSQLISQRQLAKRYGITKPMLRKLGERDGFPSPINSYMPTENPVWLKVDINAWFADTINYWRKGQS